MIFFVEKKSSNFELAIKGVLVLWSFG